MLYGLGFVTPDGLIVIYKERKSSFKKENLLVFWLFLLYREGSGVGGVEGFEREL